MRRALLEASQDLLGAATSLHVFGSAATTPPTHETIASDDNFADDGFDASNSDFNSSGSSTSGATEYWTGYSIGDWYDTSNLPAVTNTQGLTSTGDANSAEGAAHLSYEHLLRGALGSSADIKTGGSTLPLSSTSATAADDSFLLAAMGLLESSSQASSHTSHSLASQLPELLLLSAAGGASTGSHGASSASSARQVALLARVALLQEAAKAQEQVEMLMALTHVVNSPAQYEDADSSTSGYSGDQASTMGYGSDHLALQQQPEAAQGFGSTKNEFSKPGSMTMSEITADSGVLDPHWFRHLLQQPTGNSSSYSNITTPASGGLRMGGRRRVHQDDGSSGQQPDDGGGGGCGAGPAAVAWTPDSIDPTQSECSFE
jgi:hypothetical protein